MLPRQTSKKHEFYCKNPVEDHCRTPKSTRIATKNEHRRSWRAEKVRNLQTKPVLDPFKSTVDARKVRELPRKMNIEEVEEPETTKITSRSCRLPPSRNYENSQTKRTCKHETTKIAMGFALVMLLSPGQELLNALWMPAVSLVSSLLSLRFSASASCSRCSMNSSPGDLI